MMKALAVLSGGCFTSAQFTRTKEQTTLKHWVINKLVNETVDLGIRRSLTQFIPCHVVQR